VGQLPTGTVTFLFTDLEGSTRLWEDHPEAMKPALARHDEILREAIAAHDAQLALGATTWDETGPLRVRIGIHTGAGNCATATITAPR